MLSGRREPHRSLHGLLIFHPEVLTERPVPVARQVLECLHGIHQAGRVHGAVCAQRMHFTAEGKFDATLFAAKDAQTERLSEQETFAYYRLGQGETLEEKQNCDLRALLNVLHLMLRGYEPPPLQDLSRDVESGWRVAQAWPLEFVRLVQDLLVCEGPLGADVLPSLLTALTGTHEPGKVEGPAVPFTTAADDTPTSASEPAADSAFESLPAPAVAPAEPADQPTDPEQPAPGSPAVDTILTSPEPAMPLFAPVRLPNATVGREYAADLRSILSSGGPSLTSASPVKDLPPGLTLAEAEMTLTGTPSQSGEQELWLLCAHGEEGGISTARLFQLTVNPDPQSLWKDKPSNKDERFWKPDLAASTLEDSPLLVVGASRRGRSHAHVGSCRDDDFSMAWYPETGWYALTVADGAGSAKYSREGARVACEYVQGYYARLLTSKNKDPLSGAVASSVSTPDDAAFRTALRNALYHTFGTAALEARRSIEEKAAAVDATPRDFHTTLITVLARPLDSGSWFVAAFSIGDGAAALVGAPDSAECLLTRPDGGEFAGQTMFLTVKEALANGDVIMNRIKSVIVPSFEALVLVTDGISDPCFRSESDLANHAAWKQLWESEVRPLVAAADTRAGAAQRLLDWMNFPSPGHHDDRTIVLLTPTQPTATS